MDTEAGQATVHRVTKHRTQLSDEATEMSSFSVVFEHLAKTTVTTPHVAVWHTSYFTLRRHPLGSPVGQSTYDVTMCEAVTGNVLRKHFLGGVIKYP